MRLRCLAGAYAGQIRDYSTPTGLAALRTGTAEPVERPAPVVASPQSIAPAKPPVSKRLTRMGRV